MAEAGNPPLACQIPSRFDPDTRLSRKARPFSLFGPNRPANALSTPFGSVTRIRTRTSALCGPASTTSCGVMVTDSMTGAPAAGAGGGASAANAGSPEPSSVAARPSTPTPRRSRGRDRDEPRRSSVRIIAPFPSR